jgi:predicted dehydrogenase/threonine dehydrogenase-like Zn-dependent dehydrogenase
MKQLIQHQKSGDITVAELPAPQLKRGGVLVRNSHSLISAGTERSTVTTAQASMLGKARARPDLVLQVLDSVKKEGLLATIDKVQTRLDNFRELGYSCAGTVIESGVDHFKVGDRVACGGGGYASHAEVVYVPKNLVCAVPDGVELKDAAYTTVAAIAMQGVRQADVRVGERVIVTGLGLIGLITVQILKASGCAVMGLDVNERNFALAKQFGCSECVLSDADSVLKVETFTRGLGADAVIITASTKSDEPVALAMQYARKRGKVVVLGAVGMNIARSPFYEKEIDFRISCSYGPGRYDSAYEENGLDYPFGYVRWTENRNMQAALDLMAEGKLNTSTLTTQIIPVDRGLEAYDIITGKNPVPHLGILIEYPGSIEDSQTLRRRVDIAPPSAQKEAIGMGFIGAGNFAQANLLPALKNLAAPLEIVATSKPLNASSVAKKFGFRAMTTDASEVVRDPRAQIVFITTRHDSHGRYVLDALASGKKVFVEKPLTIDPDELPEIENACSAQAEKGIRPFVMVGYNRRFSEPVIAMREFFAKSSEPLTLLYRVNAGFLPLNTWYQDKAQGGRVLGELCHFVDTLQFLTNAEPTEVFATATADPAHRYNTDNVSATVTFDNGSSGTILYLASGAPAMSKEYLEAFGGGKSAVMDNFRSLVLYDGRKERKQSFSGDKGHAAEMKAVAEGAKRGESPIAFPSLLATSKVTFAILESIRSGQRVALR